MAITTEEAIEKIVESIKDSGWDRVLRTWFLSREFNDIIESLIKKTQDNERWIPGAKIMFNWMKSCPYDTIKAVIIVDEQYPYLGYSDGIPMSLNMEEDGRIIKRTPCTLLREMFDSLNKPDKPYERDPRLGRWCSQGMLIVPIACTSRMDGKPHRALWKPQLMRIVEAINEKSHALPVVLMRGTHWLEEYLNTKHVLKVDKPDCAGEMWHQWLDRLLKGQKKPLIKW